MVLNVQAGLYDYRACNSSVFLGEVAQIIKARSMTAVITLLSLLWNWVTRLCRMLGIS